jgi:tRNA G18 (ribose-2'-O)-methylase SpoU
MNSAQHLPLFVWPSFDKMVLPFGTKLIGVENVDYATDLREFVHPEKACYLLGSEDNGLPKKVLDRCHDVIQIKAGCLNVATAGAIVLYDRSLK